MPKLELAAIASCTCCIEESSCVFSLEVKMLVVVMDSVASAKSTSSSLYQDNHDYCFQVKYIITKQL